ncbi:unnamed protein product [Diatraea saccharalis]|uniref:ATP-dependent DNA helicase n=1 Tax=Diatraea saccharalis TaxID=40085 RepID=A0A9N9RDS1_9NEOP|nr:unnamed protein product [Diatraea saccharalis]
MPKLNEITTYNSRKKQLNINVPPSFPPLDQIQTIVLKDHEGKPYLFKLFKENSESASDALDDSIECDNLVIDLHKIKEIFEILTDDQRNIVMHVYFMYKNNKKRIVQNEFGEIYEDNPKIILQGPAGTGKSTIIDFIEKLITWEENKTSDTPEKIKVLKCAFTGKAASNIDGVTLNHMFSIPIYNTRGIGKKRLESKKELLANCIFFICDEISMVGKRLLDSVNIRLQLIFDNDNLYGDRFVLLVGDLYQIDPVGEKPIYPNSQLWTCCEFYELNKIIRQQDEKFINALNNFRDSKMTDEDIELLRSREIENIDQISDSVIHLFYLNTAVDKFNIEKINKSNGEEEIVNAIEDNEDWVPGNLRVKVGIRYMITKNMDVGDSLANGTTGIVKGFDYNTDGDVNVIWMEFHSNEIGKKIRSKYFKKHSKPGFERCVPIHQSSIVVKLKSDPKVARTFRNMFPLKAAEAITVHKSQGQTFHDGVCIHITDNRKDRLRFDKSLQYVALTRVKRLEDLYIYGNFNFASVKSEKFVRTENELNRLRTERKLKLAYETFEDKIGDVIIFLNTGHTFNEHYQFITTDKWYSNGSLLIFTDTNTINSDEIRIPNFEVIFRSNNKMTLRSGGGIICYKDANKSVDIVSSISDDANKSYLTLLLYEKFLYIVIGDKGNSNDDYYKQAILKLISQYIGARKCIFFIGNMDPNKGSLAYYFSGLDFEKKFSKKILTTDENNQHDMIYSRNFNIPYDNIGCYEYIPSSHKPIYVKLPTK